MQVTILAVGKPGRVLAPAIEEYERRAARYWKLRVVAVRGETASRNRPVEQVMEAEAERLRSAASGVDTVALSRGGTDWTSRELAASLEDRAVQARGDVAFLIGGAYGLHESVLAAATHRLSLSAMTLPHDLARLVLAEQLYRAGTILRGEPYHKD
jgi:23S rRNA (pseudouridine1915-N3)-methyltransferase